MKILITGGSGTIGKGLIPKLRSHGFKIQLLSSGTGQKSGDIYHWDPIKGQIDENALDGVDAIVNLAGAGIMDQSWTPARKKLLMDSRIKSTELLRKVLLSRNQKIQHFISASAVGIYGNAKDEWCTENHAHGSDFMASICTQWENCAQKLSEVSDHLSLLRIGIVLSSKGGYYTEMQKLARFGALTPIGSGKQWVSWISDEDLTQIILDILTNKISPSVYNAVSPQPLRQKDLIRDLQKHFKTIPWGIPAPAFVLKLVLGERSVALLNSQRVSAGKLMESGFSFSHENLVDFLKTCKQ